MPTTKPDKAAKMLMETIMKTPADSINKARPAPDAPTRKRRAEPHQVRAEIAKGSPTGRPAEERLGIPMKKRLNFDEMSSDEDDVVLIEMSEKLESTNTPRPGPSSELGEAQEIPDFLDSSEEDVPEAPPATNRFIPDTPEALKVRPRALNAYRLGGEEGSNFLFSM